MFSSPSLNVFEKWSHFIRINIIEILVILSFHASINNFSSITFEYFVALPVHIIMQNNFLRVEKSVALPMKIVIIVVKA